MTFPSLGFASHSICLPTSFSWSHCQWSGVEVSVDVTWVGDGVGLPGVPVVGGVDAGVDGALVDVEANVGPGVGVSGVCGWVIVAFGAGKGAGNGGGRVTGSLAQFRDRLGGLIGLSRRC